MSEIKQATQGNKQAVGQHMLKLLTEKQQKAVAGGPQGPVPPSGPSGGTHSPGPGKR